MCNITEQRIREIIREELAKRPMPFIDAVTRKVITPIPPVDAVAKIGWGGTRSKGAVNG